MVGEAPRARLTQLLPLQVSMARSGHTAEPSGPTHQYMLGGRRDMPAIGSWVAALQVRPGRGHRRPRCAEDRLRHRHSHG